jgi:hypothetical protein
MKRQEEFRSQDILQFSKTNMSKAKKSEIKPLLKRRGLFVGILTVIVIIFVWLALSSSINASQNKELKMVDTKMEFISDELSKPAQTPAPTQSTSSANYVLVMPGDSYARITKRFCGSGKNYMVNSIINGGRDLHPGETIQISCDK